MLALLASFAVLIFVLVPSWLFRIFAALFLPAPLKKFHRTKGQEFAFSVLVVFVPFFVALLLSWLLNFPLPVREPNLQRRSDYKLVFAAAASDKVFEQSLQNQTFWPAANHVIRRQIRLALWVWVLVGLEGYLFARLVAKYGAWRRFPRFAALSDKLLLRGNSHWHVLLTNFALDPAIPRQVFADVMSKDKVLYSGVVGDYVLDENGELSAISLKEPFRFDRERYTKDRDADRELALRWGMSPVQRITQNRDAYWKPIPSAVLYIPASDIANINVRHVAVEPDAAVITRAATEFDSLGLIVEPET